MQSSGAAPLPQQEQPYENICNDPVLKQSHKEEAFYSEQLLAGQQIMQSGIVETAADAMNLRLYQAHYQHFGVPEQVEQPLDVNPEMQQPENGPEPMQPLMNPMMMPGGW